MMKKMHVNAPDGRVVSLLWFEAPEATRSMLILPALGLQARWYEKLAEGMVEHQCSVCVMEYRGHGISPVRAGRDNNWGMADLLDDVDVAMHWINKKAPSLPCVLAGHSLGGHLATIYSGVRPRAIAGVVLLACAFPFHDDYPPKISRQINMLCRILPFLRWYPGYYPGERIGFGGNEALQVMNDWACWARSGGFDFDGKRDLAEDVAKFTGPVLSISFDRDDYSSPKAVRRALSPFTSASVSRQQLGPAEQGQFLGHIDWAQSPEGVLWALWHWMRELVPAAQEALMAAPQSD